MKEILIDVLFYLTLCAMAALLIVTFFLWLVFG